ncbi:hypothetical protein BC834DRAFT_460071 [Gloeopeniophorella convolvens]|nr:hypothetical protein BC834DRAFT_460071 [Gloeopeniophorella convolvens]
MSTVSFAMSHPFKIDRANLLPALPSNVRDSRYQTSLRPGCMSPPLRLQKGSPLLQPAYESRNWITSVHPEGKRYAHSRQTFTLVTEANTAESGVVDQLNSWYTLICDVAQENDIQVPEATDLFLSLNCGTCSYYFANHSLRTVFWLRSLDAASLGLPEAYSNGHLQYSLEENYWIHVELFPVTLVPQYSQTALRELQAILLHARADALTSEVPTFPYTPEESGRFIEMLQRGKEHASDPYIITLMARLRAVVANHRFITHFGEEHCRMSSQHSILEAPERKRNLILTAISKLLFGLPEERRAQLEGLWVDELAYTSAWRKHISETVEDLQQKMIWNFALLMYGYYHGIFGSYIDGVSTVPIFL